MTSAIRTRLPCALLLLLLALCPTAVHAAALGWWDPEYTYRGGLDVSVGAVAPSGGYDGYTVRLPALDTATLISDGKLQADCEDLRVVFFDDGTDTWIELDRHVLDCDTAATDIRFALDDDVAASATDERYFLYYGNPTAGAPTPLGTTNVYLWFDDASVDRTGSYVRGRIDAWHGTGWDDSLTHNAAGEYYDWSNGDNFTSGYRRAVNERDVYAEAEFFHTGCFPFNMTTGMIVRGIIASGSGGSESSNHYYASNRGHNALCGGGYSHDGDILEDQRTNTSVNGADPPAIVLSQWRRQGLAAFDTGPTELRFFDEDDSADWDALGFPDSGNLLLSGADAASENTSAGFAGFQTAQDTARIRNILIRRYVEPEPVVTVLLERAYPALSLAKTSVVVSDPVNDEDFPKRIPGALVDYTVTVTNGRGSPDEDSVVLTDNLPDGLALFVGALAPSATPFDFVDDPVTPSSVSILSVEYSDDDGATFGYTLMPVDDFDPEVDAFRITFDGKVAEDVGSGSPSFSVRYRVRID